MNTKYNKNVKREKPAINLELPNPINKIMGIEVNDAKKVDTHNNFKI